MSLPDSVETKFSIYTLACRELLNRLGHLRDLTRSDSTLPYEECIRRFDEDLRWLFENVEVVNIAQVGERLAGRLRGNADALHDRNEGIGNIFYDLVDAISYASWLRSKVASHNTKALTRGLSPYDVVNVQHLARRLLIEVLGIFDHFYGNSSSNLSRLSS